MIVLLDSDDLVVGTLPYDDWPTPAITTELGTFEYEDDAGDDHIYRLVES